MGQASKTVFLTGGAGALGAALLDCLAGPYRVICLTHRHAIAREDVETLAGDIARPMLGLDRAAFDRLASRIDWIVHAAAVTQLDSDADLIRRVNYAGTRHMLELAELARKPLYHVSTAFTHPCDYHDGVPPETAYEQEKRRAEILVRDSGLPVSIFRPSIVIGDARTGAMPVPQGFHLTLSLVMSGVMPIFPCPEGAYVDVIARDTAARAIVRALDREWVGGDHFLTSGAAAPTVASVIDTIEATAARSGIAFTRPRCVSPDCFERLIKPVFLPTVPKTLRTLLMRGALTSPYACLRSPLPSSLAELLSPADFASCSPARALHNTIDATWPIVRARAAHFPRSPAGAPA